MGSVLRMLYLSETDINNCAQSKDSSQLIFLSAGTLQNVKEKRDQNNLERFYKILG